MNDDPLASIIAAMWSEYNRDEMCDNSRIIRLMCEGVNILVTRMNDYSMAVFELGSSHVDREDWLCNKDLVREGNAIRRKK